jgi:hypothetical protein
MRRLLDAIEAEDLAAARSACTRIQQALGDGSREHTPADDDKSDVGKPSSGKPEPTPKRKSGGYPGFLDTDKGAARAAQRARMGLSVGGPSKAIRAGNGLFELSHHALAQSKGRVCA